MYVFDWNRNLIEDGSVGVCYGWVRGVSTLVVLIDPRERDEGGPSHIERAGGGGYPLCLSGALSPRGLMGQTQKPNRQRRRRRPFVRLGKKFISFNYIKGEERNSNALRNTSRRWRRRWKCPKKKKRKK